MYGVVLILVLIITGGAIAFIGDRLGTKIGKKRLSIFGLRPRHTSILITIFTGICITTLTFGVMAAVSENVRTALFGMEKLHQTMRDTQASLTQATADLAEAQDEQARTDEQLAASQADVDRLQSRQQELQAESDRLSAGNRALEAANSSLQSRNDELAGVNDQLGWQNGQLTQQNGQLTQKNSELTDSNKKLETRADELRTGLINMREGDIAFRAGEVIAAGVIKGGQNLKAVTNDMEALVQLANRNANVRLGTNHDNQDLWVYRPDYDAALQQIAGSPQDTAVRIVAAGNLLRGEPVRAALKLYQSSLIYKDQTLIYAHDYQLTGGANGEAETVVMQFLNEVNKTATAAGVLPDPIRGTVGTMDVEQFYTTVHQLFGIRGTVHIAATANGDINTLGPLRLNITVTQLPSSGLALGRDYTLGTDDYSGLGSYRLGRHSLTDSLK